MDGRCASHSNDEALRPCTSRGFSTVWMMEGLRAWWSGWLGWSGAGFHLGRGGARQCKLGGLPQESNKRWLTAPWGIQAIATLPPQPLMRGDRPVRKGRPAGSCAPSTGKKTRHSGAPTSFCVLAQRTQYCFRRKRYMSSTLRAPISTTLSWNSHALGQFSVST